MKNVLSKYLAILKNPIPFLSFNSITLIVAIIALVLTVTSIIMSLNYQTMARLDSIIDEHYSQIQNEKCSVKFMATIIDDKTFIKEQQVSVKGFEKIKRVQIDEVLQVRENVFKNFLSLSISSLQDSLSMPRVIDMLNPNNLTTSYLQSAVLMKKISIQEANNIKGLCLM